MLTIKPTSQPIGWVVESDTNEIIFFEKFVELMMFIDQKYNPEIE